MSLRLSLTLTAAQTQEIKARPQAQSLTPDALHRLLITQYLATPLGHHEAWDLAKREVCDGE
ncbi:hypothetical protein [Mariprofundus ferrooxydans]|uniref:hypothetical protein n=1 Tax=Mariprofundus ferrooxydans TaxID=314344 RepID=UPI001430B329|nr:hypothetical protein [Mariprofundus ferrooxydans]